MSAGKGPLIHEWTPSVRNWILGVFVFLVGAALVLGIVTLIEPSVRPGMREWSEIVRNVGLGVFGVLGGSFGLYIAYLRSVAAKEQADAALKAASTAQDKENRERELDQQIQIAETFAQAVEQLGNNAVSVRLGAIHALALLAKQSKSQHWPIMSIVASHVRGASYDSSEGGKANRHLEIQLCVLVLGGRNQSNDPEDGTLDLRDSDFRGIEFVGLNLDRARFGNSKFGGARLEKSSFKLSNFNNAEFPNATLSSSDFTGSQFHEAKIEGGWWNSCVFDSVFFFKTSFKAITLTKCKFNESSTTLSEMEKVNFSDCQFSGARLWSTKIQSSVFKSSLLKGANLWRCEITSTLFSVVTVETSKFEGTEFRQSKFWETSFSEAEFPDTKFIECGFSDSNLDRAQIPPIRIENSIALLPSDRDAIPMWL